MGVVHTLDEAVISVFEEKELQEDGVSDDTPLFHSQHASFISNGIKSGDSLIVKDKGVFKVVSDPTDENYLTLDQNIESGSNLVFSVAKSIERRDVSGMHGSIPLSELIFVQSLKLTNTPQKAYVPQFRTSVKKSVLLGNRHQLEFSGLLHDVELEKKLKDPDKSYLFRIFYRVLKTDQEDGYCLFGCQLVQDSISNQENSNSVSDYAYIGSFRDTVIKS